jgi:hypothetical protein
MQPSLKEKMMEKEGGKPNVVGVYNASATLLSSAKCIIGDRNGC